MSKIAFLGLGAMGSRMAVRLLDAGHDLTVWNRSPAATEPFAQRGARVAQSPAEAVANAEFVFSMVTDDNAARAIWLDPIGGAAQAVTPGTLAIECSTVSPDWVRTLAAELSEKSAGLIDAPVAGSRPQAEAGQLIFMIGGAAAHLDMAGPVLAPLSAAVHHVGGVGSGAILKLAVNAHFATQLASVAELLGFLARNGFSAEQGAELLAKFPVTSPAIAGAARMMAAGNTAPLFTIDLVAKDLTYALMAASASGATLPGVERTVATFRRAQDAGHGASNVSGLAKLFL